MGSAETPVALLAAAEARLKSVQEMQLKIQKERVDKKAVELQNQLVDGEKAILDKEIQATTDTLAEATAKRSADLDATLERSNEMTKTKIKAMEDHLRGVVAHTALLAAGSSLATAEDAMARVESQAPELKGQAEELGGLVESAKQATHMAANNVNVYVQAMPIPEYQEISRVSLQVIENAKELQKKAAAVKLVSKQTVEVGVNAMQLASKAYDRAMEAKTKARLAVEQATQNAMTLKLIQEEVNKARSMIGEANANQQQYTPPV